MTENIAPQFVPAGFLCVLITKGTTPPKSEIEAFGNIPFLRVNNLTLGGALGARGELIYVSKAAHEGLLARSKCYPGDTLINIVGPPLGKVIQLDSTYSEYNINQAILILRPNNARVDELFLYYYISSYSAQIWLKERAKKTSGQQNLTIELCKELPIPNFLLSEQRKIAGILRTWDEALEKLEVIRKAKGERLAALRSGLTHGAMRLAGRCERWAPRRLGDVTIELTERNANQSVGRDKVMGVTNSRGIVPMREHTVANDISRYKRLPPFAFAYNPMRINVGSLASNGIGETVLVSPDYVVFACRPEQLDHAFLDHLRRTTWWSHHVNAGGSGSVRQRTYYDDLADLQLHLPDLDEQEKIVHVLDAALEDLQVTEGLIETVTRQKRGLMQKLLTGEWRVPGEEPALARVGS